MARWQLPEILDVVAEMAFDEGESARRIARWVSAFPTWSSLNIIGQSRLVSLTIIVPFLGSLLLLNSSVVDFFSFIPELIPQSVNIDDRQFDVRLSTIYRLYYTYFGLSAIGFASILFITMCPSLIKTHSSSSSYIAADLPIITKSRMILLLEELSLIRIKNDPFTDEFGEKIETPEPEHSEIEPLLQGDNVNYSWRHHVIFPDSLDRIFYVTISQTHTALVEKYPDNFGFGDDGETPVFFTEREESDVSEIVKALAGYAPGYLRSFRIFFAEVALSNAADYMTINFLEKDYSRPITRIVIAVLYAIGFSILTVPTIETFVRISLRLFSTAS